MEKMERKFIKFISKKICEVLESYNCRYCDDYTEYGRECFLEKRFNEIEYFVDWAEDRGVSPAIIEYLRSMNFEYFHGKYFYGEYTV